MGIRIGIGGLKIGQGSTGVNWSSYWATLISATVENAAPTHVVLTFPTAKTELGASDFAIAGFTVSSASWTGAVLTLVLSYAVTAYSGNLTITFVTTGETGTVTNNVAMANSVTWVAHGDGSATYVTKDGSDFVSEWKDLSGASHPFLQATGTNQPKWEGDGVLFDGVDNFMRLIFAVNQPSRIYMVLKQVTWTINESIIDGHIAPKRNLIGQNTATPGIFIFAGTVTAVNNNLAVGSFGIVRALFSGANSTLQVNNTAKQTVDAGTLGVDGYVIGSYSTGAALWSNIKVKELIIRSAADDAATETAIYNYLANKHGFATI